MQVMWDSGRLCPEWSRSRRESAEQSSSALLPGSGPRVFWERKNQAGGFLGSMRADLPARLLFCLSGFASAVSIMVGKVSF